MKTTAQKNNYTALIHCTLPLMREGFETFLARVPCTFRTEYTDLWGSGVLLKLRILPDIIIIIEHEADADFGLCHKIKLFAPLTPLLVIIPKAPPSYLHYLKHTGADEILIQPFNENELWIAINKLLGPKTTKNEEKK